MPSTLAPLNREPEIHGNSTVNRWRFAARVFCVVFFLTQLTAQAHAHAALDFPNGGEMLEVGSVTHIEWHAVVSRGAATYDLWYSTSGPAGPWIVFDYGLPPSGICDWVVPDTPSTQVRVRVRQDNVDGDYFGISDSDLFIVKLSTGLEVDLEPERDATIYDDGNGTNANGSGFGEREVEAFCPGTRSPDRRFLPFCRPSEKCEPIVGPE
jgi:hypothetical protein